MDVSSLPYAGNVSRNLYATWFVKKAWRPNVRQEKLPRNKIILPPAGQLERMMPLLTNEVNMQDTIFIAVTLLFFVVSIGYVYFCDRIR